MFETQRRKIGEVTGILKQCATYQMQLIQYMEQMHHSFVKVPRDILVVNAKHLQTKVDRTLANLYELDGLVSMVMNLMDTSAPSANFAHEGEKESASNLSSLKHFRTVKEGRMTLEEAQLHLQEVKRLVDLKVEREKSEKKLRRLTSEQLRLHEQELAEIETHRSQH
nr:hypothetical protein [Tanacetum cinerariifolium]